jgi:hypothetical protein
MKLQRLAIAFLIGIHLITSTETAEAATEKTGLFVWSQEIIEGTQSAVLQEDLLTFMDSGPDPSLKKGRIVQNGASIQSTHENCPHGASTFADFYTYINKVDGAGHRFSLMYSVLDFEGGQENTDILCYVNQFLAMLKDDAFSGATSWTTNKSGGQPTIEIFLDIEPYLDGSTAEINARMVALQQVLKEARVLVNTHNDMGPHVRATLGATLTIGTIVPPLHMPLAISIPCPELGGSVVDCWECLLHYIDRAELLAYRTANCLKSDRCPSEEPVCCPIPAADCIGDNPTGTDGMAFFGYMVLKKAASLGKLVSIGIEVNPNVADCRKISFGFLMGATGYSSNPAKRVDYMQSVMSECTTEMAKAGVYASFDQDAHFTINDFNGYHCFATGGPWQSPHAICHSAYSSCSGCAPKQPPHVLAGDLNGDGLIDTLDLAEMHLTLDTGPHDTNFNGVVEIHDLLNLLSIWNTHYPMAP